MLAVGELYLGELDESVIRMTSGFAAGIGGSYLNNCGTFSAGVMISGALYGRSSADQDDQLGQNQAARFQEKFRDRFETTNCGKLREEKYGSGGAELCSVLVERAANLLMEVINDQQVAGG
jgi:C_GCAxxG_C_C family probable redox protein